jgi:hypothetical protein
VPGPTTSFVITVGPGIGLICDTNSGGTGAVKNTQTNDDGERAHANSDAVDGWRAGTPGPGNVPLPRSLAVART